MAEIEVLLKITGLKPQGAAYSEGFAQRGGIGILQSTYLATTAVQL